VSVTNVSDTSSAFVIDNKAVDILTENMNSDYQNALKKYTLVYAILTRGFEGILLTLPPLRTRTRVSTPLLISLLTRNHTKQLYYIYVPSQE